MNNVTLECKRVIDIASDEYVDLVHAEIVDEGIHTSKVRAKPTNVLHPDKPEEWIDGWNEGVSETLDRLQVGMSGLERPHILNNLKCAVDAIARLKRFARSGSPSEILAVDKIIHTLCNHLSSIEQTVLAGKPVTVESTRLVPDPIDDSVVIDPAWATPSHC